MESMSTQWKKAMLGALVAAGCNKGPDPAIGRQAAEKAAEHANEAVASIERLTRGLVDVTAKGARQLGPAMTDAANVARIRNVVRVDMHDDHTDVGRDLTLYPTWFLAAVGMDGKGLAGDREPERDFVPGKDLGAAFPCVRAALTGNGGFCVGELASGEGQDARSYLVAAQPTRAAEGQPVNGAFVTAIPYGRLAKAVRETLNLRTAHDGVQLHVGFVRNGRVIPSGRDNDVPQAYLVPDTMVPRVPANAWQRVQGGGFFTHTFTENQGRMQWGLGVAQVPTLTETAVVVFRAPLRQ